MKRNLEPRKIERALTQFLSPVQSPDELGRLGQFCIIRILGQGGMGVVFQAEDTTNGECVALKILRPDLAKDDIHRQRFAREAILTRKLQHKHIVKILNVGEANGVPYLVMPLLHGETLQRRVDREWPLPVDEIFQIGEQIADGLAYAHDQGLVHRDIKPANIWLAKVDQTGKMDDQKKERSDKSLITHFAHFPCVKILDFGLALPMVNAAHFTTIGQAPGTPLYMAPEAVESGEMDQRSDLYSLGCVLYHASTGRTPFQGDHLPALLLALDNENPTPPHELRSDLPPSVSQLIMALLSKSPADRPKTAATVRDLLHKCKIDPEAVMEATAYVCSGGSNRTTTAGVFSPDQAHESGSEPTMAWRRWRHSIGLLLASAILSAILLVFSSMWFFGGNQGILPDNEGRIPRPRSVPPKDKQDSGRSPILLMSFDRNDFYEKQGKTWVRDLSNSGNDGRLLKGATYTPEGKSGGALDCRGGGLRLENTLVANRNEYTLVGWIKADEQDPVQFYEEGRFKIDGNKKDLPVFGIAFGVNGWARLGAWNKNFLVPKYWRHATTMRNESVKRGWVFLAVRFKNGGVDRGDLLVTINERTEHLSLQTTEPRTAGAKGYFGRLLRGKIDEVAFFGSALSDKEIQLIFEMGNAGKSFRENPSLLKSD